MPTKSRKNEIMALKIGAEQKAKLFELAHVHRTTMSGLIKSWIETEWKKREGNKMDRKEISSKSGSIIMDSDVLETL